MEGQAAGAAVRVSMGSKHDCCGSRDGHSGGDGWGGEELMGARGSIIGCGKEEGRHIDTDI